MKLWINIGVAVFTMLTSVTLEASTSYKSKYIGQENRVIKSLSADAVQQLQTGKGWGLAKAAELNGMPGPSHVLQMKNKIALTNIQEIKIKTLFENMKLKAIPLGNKLIELEKELNESFSNKTITKELLSQQLLAISKTRMQLRFVHLETHLLTPAILTNEQVKKYNQLRGYNLGDPCNNVPKGHDAEMWKKHNDCR